MRTGLEAVLQAMVSEGWANESGGSVESPQGHYARITVLPTEVDEVHDAFKDVIVSYELGDESKLVGYWLVVEDEQGNVSCTSFSTEPSLTRAFIELDDANAHWAEANA